LNRTLESFHAFATDARTSVNRITDTTTNAGNKVADLADELVDAADRLSLLLSTMQRMAARIEAGEGTLGQLVNDPRLYRQMIDTTEQVAKLMQEVRVLVKQWQAQGVEMKLK